MEQLQIIEWRGRFSWIITYHDYRHLQEHLAEMAEDVKLDTEDDVYFGYFNVHDTDKDGLSLSEILRLSVT